MTLLYYGSNSSYILPNYAANSKLVAESRQIVAFSYTKRGGSPPHFVSFEEFWYHGSSSEQALKQRMETQFRSKAPIVWIIALLMGSSVSMGTIHYPHPECVP